MRSIFEAYTHSVLEWPKVTVLIVLTIVAVFGAHTSEFRLDASSDSLVLENDEALRFYRSIRERYGSDDYLIVTYSPEAPLFSDDVLSDLVKLRDALSEVANISSVTSILDVPLIESPPVSLADLREGTPTLENPKTDRDLARKELLSSPLYRDLLVSENARTTALLVQFARDDVAEDLLATRQALRLKRIDTTLTKAEKDQLATVSGEYRRHKDEAQAESAQDIATVRSILNRHKANAVLHLGGVPMIVADSIRFVRSDLVVFGIGVLSFLILILGAAFGAVRWVLLPMLTSAIVGIVMLGFLGWAGWPVTVVSSNFISVLLIITLSLMIHLIVSYQELQTDSPEASQKSLVRGMIETKVQPCLYTAITTAVAFGSLVVSGIRPVIDFGWMMVVGIGVALVVAFTFFPAVLVLLPPTKSKKHGQWTERMTANLARFVRLQSRWILIAFGVATLFCVAGFWRLSVENRFIDYFKSTTEIYRGMVLVDRELGGTTPLDVIIDAPRAFFEEEEANAADPLFEDWGSNGGITSSSYWMTTRRLREIEKIHDFLDGRPEIGKVLSLTTSFRMMESIEKEVTEDDIALSILYDKLPSEIRGTLIDPYYSEGERQIRFALRVYESDPSLDRQLLLDTIRLHLTEELGYADEQVQLTGMLVLYNNMLQSLFRTQILTVGFVFGMIWLMFIFSFRNVKLAAIAIIPNLFAGASVLGLMGWMGVPLDLMTITIAAISIGIGVDDTIHYVHRMMTELPSDGDDWGAVLRSHASVGRAMYYTTVAIALGFSILALSNFVPTIYFGLLTGLAMIAALIADLTLLPILIVMFRPIRTDKSYRGEHADA